MIQADNAINTSAIFFMWRLLNGDKVIDLTISSANEIYHSMVKNEQLHLIYWLQRGKKNPAIKAGLYFKDMVS